MFNLCFAGVFSAETDDTMSVMEGDSVTLHTDLTEIQNDDTILWLFGPKESVISQITRKNDFTSFFVTDDVRWWIKTLALSPSETPERDTQDNIN